MVEDAVERMPRVIQAARMLREVRQARLAFLWNWAQDQAEQTQATPRLVDLLPPDDEKRDWTHLYDGSVLDD
jgi:hypothetical protein